jgi:hypothetical protein
MLREGLVFNMLEQVLPLEKGRVSKPPWSPLLAIRGTFMSGAQGQALLPLPGKAVLMAVEMAMVARDLRGGGSNRYSDRWEWYKL